MARTVLTVQRLDAISGEDVAYVSIDPTNGMQARNTGREAIILKTGAGNSVQLTIPSVACSHGRTSNVVATQGASLDKSYGPFTDPAIWGDGVGQLFLDFASVVGGTSTILVAAVQI